VTGHRRHGSGLPAAIRFLTRVPVPGPSSGAETLARSVPWFPVVGGAIGALVAGVYGVGLLLWPALVAAVVAVAAGLVVTGAFHEDGLADTADALAGGSAHGDPAEALRIMRDPTLGTFGVLALVASFAARVVALAALDTSAALAVLIGAHSLGRAAAVGAMTVEPAAPDGLGAEHARRVGRREISGAFAIAGVLAIAAMGVWGVAAAVVAAIPAVALARYARRALGGITGDILGAVEQVAEVLILLGAVAIAHNGWGDVAWWSHG